MNRRQFLQRSGWSVAALTCAPLVAAVPDQAKGFAAGRARHPWLAGWDDAPLLDGLPRTATLEGRLPAGLAGTLYRTGPARFTRAGVRYRHWFDGDGLVQSWTLGDDRVEHRGRFVDTPKFVREQAAGRFVRPAAGTWIEDAEPIGNSDGMNTANTAVIVHDRTLYALWEGGSAFALDPATLETRGAKAWRDDLESVPFSAHPLHEADGSLWNFGLAGSTLLIWRIAADGQLQSITPIELPFAGYLHAFSMTASHLAFVVMPYVQGGGLDRRSFFESLQWEPQRGCRALVVGKNALDRPQWFGLPAGAAYHFGPALQRGHELVLHACWSGGGADFSSPFASEMAGVPVERRGVSGSVQRIALDLRSGRATLDTLIAGNIDFPAWNPAGDGVMHALHSSGATEHGYFDAVCTLDPQRGEIDRYRYGDHMLVEEHRFVPAPGAARARQGWLVGTVLDYRRGRTGLSVLDAERLAAGPQAIAWLPHALPLGFHGWFA